MEVGYWDTALKIKEKIQMCTGIPVSNQKLIYFGQVLPDDHDVDKCAIINDSHIDLIVHSGYVKQPPVIRLQLKTGPRSGVHLPVDVKDNVLWLKERLQKSEGKAVDKLVIHATGAELCDQQLLGEVPDNCEIDVSFRQYPATAGIRWAKNKVEVTLWSYRCGTKIPVEVNGRDKVGKLRKEVERLQKLIEFNLPEDGYFFIHKQDVMEEDKSFFWHGVSENDTIEIFPGRVTYGSR
ncbi:hypothetical protein L6164_032174 [Bauhinia variegata]|uniref:Uncharacterized protein n=1 Tax=Bauhinia variegata TaxID=167791 RepID=A0ACB9KN80_BAUVA|nr:hypothetical protein L6164_032174 [Bauhinia variegata]